MLSARDFSARSMSSSRVSPPWHSPPPNEAVRGNLSPHHSISDLATIFLIRSATFPTIDSLHSASKLPNWCSDQQPSMSVGRTLFATASPTPRPPAPPPPRLH